ncbi:MAG: hypothetical protein ACFCVA_15935 [Gammaproteobacteria bacterium]
MWAATGLVAGAAYAQGSLADGGKVHLRYHGIVPARSDVVFSTRFKRPEAPALIKAFGATRVEWVYTTDRAFASLLKEQAPWFSGTLNANGPLPTEAGFARDFDGNIITAPWMRGWGGRWVTTTHPETQRAMAGQVLRYLEIGANALQHDDPLLQLYAALNQAGDFNASTLAGFPRFLATRANRMQVEAAGRLGFTGDDRDFLVKRHRVAEAADDRRRFRRFPSTPMWLASLQRGVEEHFLRLRQQLKSTGHPVPLSMNLSALYEPLESNPLFFLTPLGACRTCRLTT